MSITITETRVDSFPLGAVSAGEGMAEGLQRVAREIDRRSSSILGSDSALEPEGVHAVRVGTKRVRALWQLHKASPRAPRAKAAIKRLRLAARRLAGLRDDHVLLMLLAELAAGAPAGASAGFERARLRLVTPLARQPAADGACPAIIAALEADAADWLEVGAADDVELLHQGLRRAFTKTRDLGRKALDERTAEDLHRWRRWVKYLRYQLEPFATAERHTISAYHAELKGLGSNLGKRNDLHNLRHALGDGGEDVVLEAIEARDRVLETALPELEDTLLHLSPDGFVASVEDELSL